MLSYCTKYLAAMPDITVYMNCDTRLAINLSMFDIGEYDEFIFVIKNFSYIESPYVFLFRARKTDADENGEVIFKIDPDSSKALKPGAFYNFALLMNAHNEFVQTEYRKLTENGRVIIEYGAQELTVGPAVEPVSPFQEIIAAQLKPVDEGGICRLTDVVGTILDVELDEVTGNV